MRSRAARIVSRSFPILGFFILVLAGTTTAQTVSNPKLRSELLAMRDRDQAARNACPTGNADEQLKCYVKISQDVDAPHTKRLNEIVRTNGVPDETLVGPDGFEAYYLILQHSNDLKLKQKSLKSIEKAFKSKILSPMDYANFTDRLLVNLGKQQVYGANFDLKDGKMVMSPTRDIKNLDKRRKEIGLPPIAEYMRKLEEIYKIPAVMPESK
jgi:hypothetical protein